MNLIDLVSKKWVLPTAVGLTSGTIGVVGGYIYGTRKALAEAEELLMSVEEMIEELRAADAEEEVPDAVQGEVVLDERIISEEEANWIITNQLREDNSVEEIVENTDLPIFEPVVENKFETNAAHDDSWDQEAEMQTRTNSAPYIIHEDEYFSDDMGYRQVTLTYYAGDDIMVDDKDIPIYNHSNVVGELKFGHGASNSSTLYVRNEELRGEYEILHNEGMYQIEVLGAEAEDELMHGNVQYGLRKFRDD